MGKMKDYNCCPYCGSLLTEILDHDACLDCGWRKAIPQFKAHLPTGLPHIQPGGVFEGNSGRYERTMEGDWLCLDTNQVLSDSELFTEEGMQ